MPQVVAVKIGEVIPVRCCCGMENHPMPFIPGDYTVECTKQTKGEWFWSWRKMKVKMSVNSEGLPEIDTDWK